MLELLYRQPNASGCFGILRYAAGMRQHSGIACPAGESQSYDGEQEYRFRRNRCGRILFLADNGRRALSVRIAYPHSTC
ncbi:hypothetical protein EVAR_48036_1 [Eumeta japonica]|uniref:Uncharacterized protein n=1 Tax=Eumeta variegata TaxID=151549 RepID=A0A4C1XFI3_EUMVA|nr:hypothetical protein EVAR_48036_1 [Eumeta japonica]